MKEYIKNEVYIDNNKFQNHLWYGLCKVLGDSFCNSGYFSKKDSKNISHWDLVKKGSLNITVDNVLISADMSTGIVIKELERQVTITKEVVTFRNVESFGEGFSGDVYVFKGIKQLGFIKVTTLNDDSADFAKELANIHKLKTTDLTIRKYWL